MNDDFIIQDDIERQCYHPTKCPHLEHKRTRDGDRLPYCGEQKLYCFNAVRWCGTRPPETWRIRNAVGQMNLDDFLKVKT